MPVNHASTRITQSDDAILRTVRLLNQAAHHTYPPKRNKLNWFASVITGVNHKAPRAAI